MIGMKNNGNAIGRGDGANVVCRGNGARNGCLLLVVLDALENRSDVVVFGPRGRGQKLCARTFPAK